MAMNNNRMRVVFVSLIMIFSSLAGCIGDESMENISDDLTDIIIPDEGNITVDENSSIDIGMLGSVMVSTYHVGELVKAIAGDHVDLQYMSTQNIPVHDYDPTAVDLIRLSESDVFFYHGLGLEPWVDEAISSLGANAPTAIQVHTMPTGEETLDYESLLVTDLCETLSMGPYETVELVDEEEHADDVEIHAEFTAHNITFPDEEHDDHADEDGHDDHNETEDHDDHDGHDDHNETEDHADEEGHDDHDGHEDGHEGHAHIDAEETISNPAGCPADTMISIFHLEEGEYVMEFDADNAENFTMAVLKMLGGHAHHDHHGHGDENGDEHGVCHDMSDHSNNTIDNQADCEAAGFEWMEEDDHGDEHGDDDHDDHGPHEDPCADHGDDHDGHGDDHDDHGDDHDDHGDDHDDHGDDHDDHDGDSEDQLTPEDALELADSNNDSHISWDEFWDSWNDDGDADHDDHDDHDEEHHGVVVLFPDNCLQMYVAEDDMLPENATGWNLTTSAMMGDDSLMLNYSVHEIYGTNVMGINGFMTPADYSWYWQLMLWNGTENNTGWEVSNVGIDSVMIPEMTEHIAWMPNSSNMSHLPDLSMMHDEHDGHDDHERTFHCSSTVGGTPDTEIPFSLVNDGTEDCGDGSDEPQDFNGDGSVDNWFDCMDGSNVSMELVNDGNDDCPDGEDESHGHDDHDGHGDMGVCHDPVTHENHDEYLTMATCEDAGYVWMEDGHDDHEGDYCHDTTTHENTNHTTQADCEAAGHMWIEEDGHDDHDEPTEAELMEVFNASDVDGDQLLNITELSTFIELLEELEEGDHHEEEHHAGYVTIHINAEGDYGFALPMGVEFHIMMGEGGHEGHDDHAGHDDHDDHAGEDGDDHADHAEEDGDDHAGEDGDDHADHAEEDSLDYDPHSWLSPLAFKAQVNVVLDGLTAAFPAGEDVFKANADIYAAQLTALDVAFDTAFGEDGLCMAGNHEKTVAANHNAYSYIAVQYGIQFMTVHGLDPEGEPSPEDVAKVVNFINEEGITVLFVEEYTDQSSVQSIVDETGVSIQILYTMEMAPSDSSDNYMTMMTKNLENLVAGIGC